MSSPLVPPPPLSPEDKAKVLKLAKELHGISIATEDECEIIARALLDKGCTSLYCFVEIPIKTLEELRDEIGELKNATLSKLQLRIILKWIEQQRILPSLALQRTPAIDSESDIGSKRPHPVSSPLLALSQGAPLMQGTDASFAVRPQTPEVLPESRAEALSPTMDAFNYDADHVAALQFMEVV